LIKVSKRNIVLVHGLKIFLNDMENSILISIIIPSYNTAKYIEETFDSIKNQTLIKKAEIIFVNDGSTDDTLLIFEKIKSDNQSIRIKIIDKKNSGPSSARNFGANVAIGKYIVFIDADDKIDPKYLEKSINILENNPKIEIVYSKAKYFEAKKGQWKLSKFELKKFLIQNCIPIFSVLRTENFNFIGKFDEQLYFFEDWELWIRFVKNYNDCVYRIPETLFYYRKRIDQNSSVDLQFINRVSEKALIYIYNKHYDFFYKNNLGLDKLFDAYRYKDKYYKTWYRKLFYLIKSSFKKY